MCVAVGVFSAGQLVHWDFQEHASVLFVGAIGGSWVFLTVAIRASSTLSEGKKGLFGGLLGALFGGVLAVLIHSARHKLEQVVLFVMLFGMVGYWRSRGIYWPGPIRPKK
jgi:hypothetical protein